MFIQEMHRYFTVSVPIVCIHLEVVRNNFLTLSSPSHQVPPTLSAYEHVGWGKPPEPPARCSSLYELNMWLALLSLHWPPADLLRLQTTAFQTPEPTQAQADQLRARRLLLPTLRVENTHLLLLGWDVRGSGAETEQYHTVSLRGNLPQRLHMPSCWIFL